MLPKQTIDAFFQSGFVIRFGLPGTSFTVSPFVLCSGKIENGKQGAKKLSLA